MVNFLTYKQWKENEMVMLSIENPKIECPTCDGEGVVYDECDCCGHETEETCDDCEQSGRAKFNDISGEGQHKYLSRERYLSVVKLEFSLLAAYEKKDEAALYFNNGFIAYCNVYDKNIMLMK